MPEKTGTVTGFIQKKDGTKFGLNLDGEEYLYSFPDRRGEPWEADNLKTGDIVRIEYNPFTKDGKTKQYIAVIELVDGDSQFPPVSEMQQDIGKLAAQWGYEQKDRLMCRESCAKSASSIIAAAIHAQIYKPDVEAERLSMTVTALAGALEKWCLEAIE